MEQKANLPRDYLLGYVEALKENIAKKIVCYQCNKVLSLNGGNKDELIVCLSCFKKEDLS